MGNKIRDYSIIPTQFNFYRPYLVPGLIKVAKELGYEPVDFYITDKTSDRLGKDGHCVYSDIIEAYKNGLIAGHSKIKV